MKSIYVTCMHIYAVRDFGWVRKRANCSGELKSCPARKSAQSQHFTFEHYTPFLDLVHHCTSQLESECILVRICADIMDSVVFKDFLYGFIKWTKLKFVALLYGMRSMRACGWHLQKKSCKNSSLQNIMTL